MPLSFVAIDFETANFDRDSACAIGVTKVVDGHVGPTRSWFVQPPGDASFTNTYLHGIGPEHVAGAPTWTETLRRLAEITDGLPLVAYSPFDKGVYNAANRISGVDDPGFVFFDALAIARSHCQLPSHRLPLVVAHLGLPSFDHHEAGADSRACALVALRIAEERGLDTVEELWAKEPKRRTRSPRDYVRKADLPQPSEDADPSHPLFGEVVCFSGDLDSYTRARGQEVVTSFGASVSSNVTKKTTLVVMGGFDPATLRTGATLSSKVMKAKELAAAGQSIEIVTEQTFLEILAFG
ncbi:exonuclease domain-containing protein [Clavibacter zhangzhiyongii]|jgi:DNA polymerase-3 subunit epsilon|uniref:exonuclease domain-containing protein n=1 Tax=Clavibacter zhangzhiyongii TaxID=2768071 RepID=UPI0039E19273